MRVFGYGEYKYASENVGFHFLKIYLDLDLVEIHFYRIQINRILAIHTYINPRIIRVGRHYRTPSPTILIQSLRLVHTSHARRQNKHVNIQDDKLHVERVTSPVYGWM